jgi:hypothetical protein
MLPSGRQTTFANRIVRRLGIFGQRDKLKAGRSKRGVRSGRKEEAAQRGVQSAGGDGGAFGGEDPGGAVGGVWGSSDDDQQLEAGAGEACGGAVRARQQSAGGRDAQKVIDDLHRKIGQLQVECDFLAGQPAISRVLRGGR